MLAMILRVRILGRLYSLPRWKVGAPVLGGVYRVGSTDRVGVVVGGYLDTRRVVTRAYWSRRPDGRM